MIKSLYQNSTSAMLFNSIQDQKFKTTIGVRKGCLLSPVLFNLFLEKIMTGILTLPYQIELSRNSR